MKCLLLLIYIVIGISCGFSQDFGKVGTKWTYNWNSAGNDLNLKYESVKDTLINGITTHKISRNFGFDPIFIYQNLDTVFQYNNSLNTFFTLLIFNKIKGDTLNLEIGWPTLNEPYRMVVDSVFNITIDGITLKKYEVRGLDAYNYSPSAQPEYIVDRLGSLDYFYTQSSFSLGSHFTPLRCFEDSLIDTNFTALPCDYKYFISINELSNSLKIKLSPNPANNFLNISSVELEILGLQVFDIQGKEISIEINSLNQLNVSFLKKGMYFLKVHTTQGVITKKWVKD